MASRMSHLDAEVEALRTLPALEYFIELFTAEIRNLDKLLILLWMPMPRSHNFDLSTSV